MSGYDEILNLDSKNYINDLYIPDFCDEEEYKSSLLNHVYVQTGHRIDHFVKKYGYKKNPSEIYNNIIPLLGDRGTGKTSAMESVVRLLTDMKYFDIKNDVLELNDCNDVGFVAIDRISADILSSRGIFETVLIAMFNKYSERCKKMKSSMDRSKDYMRRDLSNQFAVIYECFKNKDNKLKDISNLYEVSQQINLKAGFCELVDLYTKFMSDNLSNKSFLIIPIDDLDQNINRGYRIMEEIHQYFMSYNIIIFVTMDLLQFSYVCEKHFSNISPRCSMIIEESKDTSKKKQYWMKYVSKITQNYIDKILPAENRVYLPGIHNENRIVKLKNFESEQDRKGKLKEQPIKWVILNKILKRTGIICDGLGRKKHYYEPGTVRKVVRLVNNLGQMDTLCTTKYFGNNQSEKINFTFDKVNLQKEDFCKVLQSNIEIIYKDIVERMEYEKMQPDVRVDFDNIRRQHITRQGQTAMRMVLREVMENALQERPWNNIYFSDTLHEFMGKITQYNLNDKYNYGNYIYVLQQYSCFNIKKELVHMLLAMQTANMTNLYNNILLHSDNKKEELFSDLRQIINGSISGFWFSDMLYHSGGISIDEFKSNKYEQLKSHTIRLKNSVSMYNVISILCCFFNGDKEYQIQKELNCITIQNINSTKIDPLGFVMWYFDAETRKKIIDSHELKNKEWYEEWYEEYRRKDDDYTKCALPIYSLDVYYNLLKRLYENKEIHFEKCKKVKVLYTDNDIGLSYEIQEAEHKWSKAKENVDVKKQELDEAKKVVETKKRELNEAEKEIETKKKELNEAEKEVETKTKELEKKEAELKETKIYKEGKEKIYNIYLKMGQAYCQLLYRIKHLLKKQDDYYNTENDNIILTLENIFFECPFVKLCIPEDNMQMTKDTQYIIHLVIGFLLFNKIANENSSLESPNPLV